MARCPECAGAMEFNHMIKQVVCMSCGLSLTRHDLETYWQKVRSQNMSEADETEKKKSRKREWLDWYSSSKTDKGNY